MRPLLPPSPITVLRLAGWLAATLVAAYLLLIWAPNHLPTNSFAGLALSAGGLAVLVILRQVLAVRENRRLLEAERRRREADAALFDLSRRLLAASDENAIARCAVEVAHSTLAADLTLLVLPDSAGALAACAAAGWPEAAADAVCQQAGPETQIGHTISSGQPIVVADYRQPLPFTLSPEVRAQGVASGVSVPLAVEGRRLGAIIAHSRAPRHFDDDAAGRLALIANQTAAAIDKVRLFEVRRRQLDELTVLHAVVTAAAEAVTEDELIERVTRVVSDVLFSANLGVLLADRAAGVLRAHVSYQGSAGFVTPLGVGITGYVAQTGEAVRVGDVSRDPRYLDTDPGMHSELCVPMVGSDAVIGAINVESARLNAFSEADERLLMTIGRQVATAIERLRLFEGLFQAEQQRAGELEAVRQASLGLTASLEPQAVLRAILHSVLRLVPAAVDVSIFLYHPENGGRLSYAAALARAGALPQDWAPRTNGVTATVARQGAMVLVPDMRQHESFAAAPPERTGAMVSLPLKIGARVVGVMNAVFREPRQFVDSELRVLQLVGDQAAIAIENARLYEDERAAREQAEALREVAATLTTSLDRERLLSLILEQLARVVSYDSASIMLFTHDRLSIVAHSGFRAESQRAIPEAAGELRHVSEVIENRAPLIIADTQSDPRWQGVLGSDYIRCWLGVPLVAQGRVIGVLNLDKATAYHYTPHDAEMATVFANQAAMTIENARLFEESQRQTRTLRSLYSAVLATGSVLETDVLLNRLYEQVAQLLNPDTFVVAFYHPQTEEVEVVLAIEQGRRSADAVPQGRLPVAEGLTGWVIRTRQSLLIADLAADVTPAAPRHGTRPARAWLGVPLITRDGIIGAVSVQSFRPGAFDEADERFLESVASQVAIAIENARLYAEVSARANELSRLYAAAQDLGARLEPRAVLEQLAKHLTEAVDATSSYVVEVNLGTELLTVLAEHWAAEAQPEERVSSLGQVRALSERPTISRAITRLTVMEMQADDPALIALERIELLRYGVKSALIVPIVARGEVLGEAEVYESRHARVFTLAERRLVQTLCQHAAGVIENARLFSETLQHADEVTTASEILHLLNASSNVLETFAQIAAAIKSITGCERVSIAMLDASHAKVSLVALDRVRQELPRGAQFPITETAAAADVLAGHIHLTPDLEAESAFPVERQLLAAGFRSRLNLPLRVGSQVIGSLNLVWRAVSGYMQANLPLLSQLVDAIALAVEKTRLFDETRRRDAILEALAYASGRLLLPGEPDAVMPDMLAQLGQAAGVSRAYIFRNDSGVDGQLVACRRHAWAAPGQVLLDEEPDWQRLPYVAEGFERWRQTLAAGRPLDGLVRDFPDSERPRLQAQRVLSLAIVPIFSGGEWWGWLGFDDCEQERIWSGAEIEALKSVAGTLGAFIVRQRIEAAEHEQRALAEALRDAAAVLSSTLDLDEVLDRILTDVGRVVPHESANIMLVEAGVARVVRTRDLRQRFSEATMLALRYEVSQVPNLAYMLETRQPTIIVDTATYAGWARRPETDWIRSNVGAPIQIKGEVIGFITLDNDTPGFYNPAHAERLQAFAHQAGLAIENARLYASIRQHAVELEQRVLERTRELAEANARLQELDRLKDQFVSNVSHELRTPLTNIKLHLGLLERRGPDVLPRYLPTLQRETERLRRLIEDLLDLSRLQTQPESLVRELVPLDDLVAEVLAVHTARAEAKRLALQYEPSATPIVVPVDRPKMIQVFTNLIGNAVAYTQPGGTVSLTPSLLRVGTTAGVSLRFFNNGPAIPLEDVPHLFERFFRGRTGIESGEAGTGLGLAICRAIVERHGGQIDVASAAELGTTFTVWLPLS